jgi:AraC-like DNA-binding protein
MMLISKPSAELTPFVKQYWGIEDSLSGNNNYSIKIVPTGLIELDFYLGYKPEIKQPDRSITEYAILNGQQKQHYDIQIADNLFMFSVIFQPAGAMFFFDVPLNKLSNQNVPLKYLFKNSLDMLESELYEAENFDERTKIMNRYLLGILRQNYRDFEYNRIYESIKHINQVNGSVDIETLASRACLSRKQFERTFQTGVGITPKQFLRIVRFQYSLYNKSINSNITLTELAYKCGYYDQSHMIADFKSLTGLTPGQYFSNCEPMSDYFL